MTVYKIFITSCRGKFSIKFTRELGKFVCLECLMQGQIDNRIFRFYIYLFVSISFLAVSPVICILYWLVNHAPNGTELQSIFTFATVNEKKTLLAEV